MMEQASFFDLNWILPETEMAGFQIIEPDNSDNEDRQVSTRINVPQHVLREDTRSEYKKRLAARSTPSEESVEWHFGFLRHQLRQLMDPASGEELRQSILRWISTPLGDDSLDFSFEACCLAQGVDPETVAADVLYQYRRKFNIPREKLSPPRYSQTLR